MLSASDTLSCLFLGLSEHGLVLCVGRKNPSRLRNWHPFLPQTRLSTGNATEPPGMDALFLVDPSMLLAKALVHRAFDV